MHLQKNNIDFNKKRIFDISFSFLAVILFMPLIILGWLLASCSTKSNGFFIQSRVGQNNKIIKVIKLKTMIDVNSETSSITALNEKRITKIGFFLRKTKLDELPQLINVLLGSMSFVGPRPDVPGYIDKLEGPSSVLQYLKPGITGLATLKFKKEEEILNNSKNPKYLNDNIIYPVKVYFNIIYMQKWSLLYDFEIILQTLFSRGFFFEKIVFFNDINSCMKFKDNL